MKKLTILSATILALAAFTTTAAAATTHRNLYEANGTTVAPNGTTFTASSRSIHLTNSDVTVDCPMTINGTVTDNGSTSGTPTFDISPTFGGEGGCSTNVMLSVTATANNEPWVLTMPQIGNPAVFTGVDLTVNWDGIFICEYNESAADNWYANWNNGTPSRMLLYGTLAYKSGSGTLFCGSHLSVSGTIAFDSTSTPGDNFEILPAP